MSNGWAPFGHVSDNKMVQYSTPQVIDPGQAWGDIFGTHKDPGDWFSGMPGEPGFNKVYDPSTMSMLPGYEDFMKKNSAGYNAFRSMALRNGPSNWANLASTQQEVQGQDQKNKAVQSTNAATAGAQDQLAMRGGLTSGARERAVEAGANNLTGSEQGIERQTGQNKLQISMNDEQNRMSELGQLPGMESSRAGQWEGVRAADNQNNILENQAKNAFDQNLYNQKMTAWAAGKQAEATANSGKHGGAMGK